MVSIYARQSQYDAIFKNQATVHFFSPRFLGIKSFGIALPVNALGFYLENIEQFPAMPDEELVIRLQQDHNETFSESGLGTDGEFEVQSETKREKFEFTRRVYPHSPQFQKWVLNAYKKTCCVCDRQLGIIEAAHIIPHSREGSTNDVTIGLALCVEHHRLYDQALLLLGRDQTLIFNEKRAEFLRFTNQQKGLDEIKAWHKIRRSRISGAPPKKGASRTRP